MVAVAGSLGGKVRLFPHHHERIRKLMHRFDASDVDAAAAAMVIIVTNAMTNIIT